MIEVKDLLGKFKNLLNKEEGKKLAVREVFKKSFDLDLDNDSMKFSDRVLFLNIKPILKNEIFLKKDFFISEINSMIGSDYVKDIR